MRSVASFPTQESADRLAKALQERGLPPSVEQHAEEWVVSIDQDDRISEAQAIALQFTEPDAVASSSTPAQSKRRRRKGSSTFRVFGWIIPPVTLTLIAASIVVSLLIHFGDKMDPVGLWLGIQPFGMGRHGNTAWSLQDSPWKRLAQGEIWRLFTPMFLHFRWWHLLGNVLWTYSFGGAVEYVRGPLRLIALVLLSSATSSVAQYLSYGPSFGGLSGVGYALFGYVWMKVRFQPDAGFRMPRFVFWLFWVLFFVCVSGLLGPIANTAHVVGLITGILFGLVPKL